MNLSLLVIVLSQAVAALLFAINGEPYDKVMTPLFFGALMSILLLLTDINNKMKPS